MHFTQKAYRDALVVREDSYHPPGTCKGVAVGEAIKWHDKRLVHTMKIMHIESKLICIACIHTECALTTINLIFVKANNSM